MANNIQRYDILGIEVSAINMEDAVSAVEQYIKQKENRYICTCPINTIIEARRNRKVFEAINSAALVTPDGVPVVWIGKLKGFKKVKRVYGPDLMLELCRISQDKGYKNYFYGSTPEVLSMLSDNLKVLFPRLIITGMYSPPFQEIPEEEDTKIIETINKTNSDVLWVGLGSPRQDVWMYGHRDKMNIPVIIGVGAAFDFIAGTKKQAPKWMQKFGLEWLFRLVTEPKRLWKRYIFGNPLFVYLMIKEFFRNKIIKSK